MIIVSRYALIIDGIVTNVIEADYQNANKIANLQNAQVINVDQYPVQPQDVYQNGVFYRDEVAIERIPTIDEILQFERNRNLEQDVYLIDNDFRISLIELGVY